MEVEVQSDLEGRDRFATMEQASCAEGAGTPEYFRLGDDQSTSVDSPEKRCERTEEIQRRNRR